MDAELADIALGMTVVSSDGVPLGTVTEIHTPTPEEVDQAGPNMVDGARDRHYLKVQQGGLLGVGAKILYVPLDDISSPGLGEGVVVDCPEDECRDRYNQMPDVAAQTPGLQ